MDIGQEGIFWKGVHKPSWTTHDLLAAHLLRVPEETIDMHKEWAEDQCEIGPDCRYCATLSAEEDWNEGGL